MLQRTKPTRLAETIAAIRRQLPLLVLLSCLLNILMLVTAVYMLQVYDRVLSSGSLDTLVWLTVIAVFAIAIYGLLEHARRTILGRASSWLDSELNAPMLKRAMEARLAGEEGRAGVRDVSDLRNFYAGDAALAFLDSPWSVLFLAFIWALHPALGMVATGGAVALFLLAVANDMLTRERQKELTGAERAHQENAIRFVDGGETIGPLGMARPIFGRWGSRQAELNSEMEDVKERTTVILSLSRSIRLGLQVMILGVGAYYVLDGQITAGAMIAASIVMGRALAPIERSTAAWRSFVAARTARQNLEHLFRTGTRDEAEQVSLPRPSGRLVFDNVFYSPPGRREPILRAIAFALDPGDNCAVLGASGAGKSSLCRLAVGAWRPAHGNVRIDGADAFEWDPNQLGPHLGYLPQQVELFPGTVAQNIARFGEIDSQGVIRAARLAGVHELILSLPAGYETEIALHSRQISLGQRQRLGLARALYGDPALIVLDEPNANMDEAGDRALVEALTALKQQGSTVLIVTHRASVLKCADKVLALRNGEVAGFGPRDKMVRAVQPAAAAPVPIPFAPPAPQRAEDAPLVLGGEHKVTAAE